MKKVDLVKKEEFPKLLLGGISIYTITWFLIFVTGMVLMKVISSLIGSAESYGEMFASGLPNGNAIYQVGFLTGIIMLVALILLVILVAYDEFYFAREIKGTKKRLFWGASWGLIFVVVDMVVGSICFNSVNNGNCSSMAISDYMGIFYWLFVALIVVLPAVSEHYGRAKASYKSYK